MSEARPFFREYVPLFAQSGWMVIVYCFRMWMALLAGVGIWMLASDSVSQTTAIATLTLPALALAVHLIRRRRR